MSAWPAKVIEWPDIRWAMEVTAHEWTHHYLSLYPLGWEYVNNQETRTINETTASIVGGMCGAIAGAKAFPVEWIDKLEEVNDLHLEDYADKLTRVVSST